MRELLRLGLIDNSNSPIPYSSKYLMICAVKAEKGEHIPFYNIDAKIIIWWLAVPGSTLIIEDVASDVNGGIRLLTGVSEMAGVHGGQHCQGTGGGGWWPM